jgi:hypothetical protein
MKITKHPFGFNYKDIYPEAKMIGGFEGGAIHKATKKGKYYLIIDEGTMADFLDDDDRDLLDELVQIIEFESESKLNNYLKKHHGKIFPRSTSNKNRTKK